MMNSLRSGNALREYSTMGLQGLVDDASPHELVRMLMDGALARMAAARGQLERHEVAAKGESIGRAISIVDALRSSLDMERGGDVAANLDSLYEYMNRRLLEASARNDGAILGEVQALLEQLRDGWQAIAPGSRPAGAVAGASESGTPVAGSAV